LETAPIESRPSDEQFPAEPFPCPVCGQLLAPSCRVCVACKHEIDAAELRRPSVLPVAGQPTPRELGPVRFSWRILLIVLMIWVPAASLVQRYMEPLKGQLVLGGVQILCSLWVFYDALEKRLPKPLRWGIGTLLLWPIIFPWYLARRKAPGQPCPFVEAQVRPITRTLLLILLAVFVYLILKQPPLR
jgi:4-hydroxybenzoate polyprenyltransferase